MVSPIRNRPSPPPSPASIPLPASPAQSPAPSSGPPARPAGGPQPLGTMAIYGRSDRVSQLNRRLPPLRTGTISLPALSPNASPSPVSSRLATPSPPPLPANPKVYGRDPSPPVSATPPTPPPLTRNAMTQQLGPLVPVTPSPVSMPGPGSAQGFGRPPIPPIQPATPSGVPSPIPTDNFPTSMPQSQGRPQSPLAQYPASPASPASTGGYSLTDNHSPSQYFGGSGFSGFPPDTSPSVISPGQDGRE